MAIHVSEESLYQLKQALGTVGEDYMKNYNDLSKLIEEITSGDIQGDPAIDLLNKYNDKKAVFQAVYDSIVEAKGYLEDQQQEFGEMIEGLSSIMR